MALMTTNIPAHNYRIGTHDPIHRLDWEIRIHRKSLPAPLDHSLPQYFHCIRRTVSEISWGPRSLHEGEVNERELILALQLLKGLREMYLADNLSSKVKFSMS